MKNTQFFTSNGTDAANLEQLIPGLKQKDADWEAGKVFGFVYKSDITDSAISEKYFREFMHESTLNPTAFPSLRLFEKDIVHMATELMHGDSRVAGSITTGGTESIFLSLKVARQKALEKKGRGEEFEVILPETIHPAFLKACEYLSLKPLISSVREDKRADPSAIEKLISSNTILICASAPCFPYGVVDPVSDIALIARKHKLLFHVDACMGGFMLPFLKDLGYKVPDFDFSLKGVTSISLDAHKYGYAPKGVSIVLYRNRSLRKRQFFVNTDWSGGIFVSTTFMGTKSGGPLAGCWALMKKLGRQGYIGMAEEVMHTTRKIRDGIQKHKGLEVISDPDMSVLAFRSKKGDIFNIGDALCEKGWHLDRLQFPEALHMTISMVNVGMEYAFLDDLATILESQEVLDEANISMNRTVKALKRVNTFIPVDFINAIAGWLGKIISNKAGGKQAALYGISARLRNNMNVNKFVLNLIDGMY